MLRINLLPDYVAERRLVKLLRGVFAVLAIAILAATLGYSFYLQKEVSDETIAAQQAVDAKNTIDGLNSQAQGWLAKIGPIKDKVKFYQDVMAWNPQTADLFSRIARWTSPAIYYTDMTVNGSTLDIKGYTKSIADLNRYLLYMYTEPDVSSVSLMSSLPNFNAAMQRITLYKGQKLNTGTNPQQGGPAGMPGGPPQGFGGPPGAGRPFGGPPNFGPNGQGMMGANNQAALLDPGLAAAIQTGAGTTTGYQRVDSFAFEVSCQLKKPLMPPGDPAAGGAAGAAGGAAPAAAGGP